MDFSDKIQTIYKHGAISFSIQLAKDIGVFDALRDADGSLTSQQVADSKNLKERYVREILGCLASASLVQVSTNEDGEYIFHLKQEDKEAISKGCLLGFTAALAETYVPVRACCHKDGPYGSRYKPETFKLLDEFMISGADSTIAYLIESVPDLQTRLEKGIKVFEIGSGTGRLLSKLANRFPNSSFVASEWKDELVSKLKVKWGDIPNMQFEIFDVMTSSDKDLPCTKYDWVLTVDVLHDLPHPQAAMENVRKILEPECGIFMAHDFGGPGNPVATVGNDHAALINTLATFLCIPESFQSDDSEAHGASWGLKTATSIMEQAGFDVDVLIPQELNALYVCRSRKGLKRDLKE